MPSNNETKPSQKLMLGIFFVPIIFAWYTLKNGYSKKVKVISFSWLVVVSILAIAQNSSHPSRVQLNSQQFGSEWPLSVSSGVVECVLSGAVIFTDENHRMYAVNGFAKSLSKEYGFQSIDSIWLNNPKNPGTKIDIGPILHTGVNLCK